jgi:hypothetical protein
MADGCHCVVVYSQLSGFTIGMSAVSALRLCQEFTKSIVSSIKRLGLVALLAMLVSVVVYNRKCL